MPDLILLISSYELKEICFTISSEGGPTGRGWGHSGPVEEFEVGAVVLRAVDEGGRKVRFGANDKGLDSGEAERRKGEGLTGAGRADVRTGEFASLE